MMKEVLDHRFHRFRPQCVPALRRALFDGYQMSIEDIGFTDIGFQLPCSSGESPHSRWNSEIDISGKLTSGIKLRLPILSSSMSGVTSFEVAKALGEKGGLAVLPREMPLDELVELANKLRNCELNGQINTPWYAGAIGVYPRTGPKAIERVNKLVDCGIEIIFIESQQADSALMMRFCEELKRIHSHVNVIMGNFNTAAGVHRAINAGASGVKVGIGTGDACWTSVMSGVTKGQVNTIFEIAADFMKNQSVPVIVDGGTSTPGGAAIMMTILKGNGTIMLGSKIAATRESSSKKDKQNFATIEGMGSAPVADRRGEPVSQRILEGGIIKKEVTESIYELLLRYEGGFRTAMYGYHGAKNWIELANIAIIGLNSPSNISARLYR